MATGTSEQVTRRPSMPERWPLSTVTAPAGALVTAPGMARAHVRDVLGRWGLGDMADTAELIVSELISNVVTASADADGRPVYADGRLAVYQLGMFSDCAELLIEVWDTVPGVPVESHAAPDDEHGRGLEIVGALATWGWFPHRGGKITWARMPGAVSGGD